ncbi:hypothetical protein ABBQ32_006105 [Trebouxia sp. C0010 RCD-2024]
MLAVDSSLEKHRAVIDRMQVFRPVVSHQQVRADRDLFYTALKQLHELLGGQLRVPNVALKQLDLHLLYKEVTEEGGLERVVHKKLWGKVCAPFQFPASYTSRSFSMKQHYVKLLYDFEEVYFHQYSGPLPVPLIDDFKLDDSQRKRTKHSEDPPTASTVYVIAKEPLQGAPNRSGQRKDEPVCPVIARKGRNASANPSAPISMPPAFTGFHHGQAIQNGDSLIGALVTGHVDSKIDCGYFITIFINGYSFQGVLYQPPKPASESGGSNLPIVVPTPKDVPPQTLRPSSPLDDYYSSEPDKDDQVHAADLTATECAQAFPVDPGMSFTDSMQLDSTSSFEQAEPLPVDPALVSPLHQEGMSDVREDWSKVGSPHHPKPSCTALPIPDWLAALADPRTHAPTAGQTGNHDEQFTIHKGSTPLADSTRLHNSNIATSQSAEHPADPSDCGHSSLRSCAKAAQMAHEHHRQLQLPVSAQPSAVYRVPPSRHEGQLSEEAFKQSSQPLDFDHGSSPSGRVMTGKPSSNCIRIRLSMTPRCCHFSLMVVCRPWDTPWSCALQ